MRPTVAVCTNLVHICLKLILMFDESGVRLKTIVVHNILHMYDVTCNNA